MMNIKYGVDIYPRIESIAEISENQIAVKISNPLVEVEDENPFMVYLSGFHDSTKPDQQTVIFIPLIEQYYHNFFEVFSRLMMLRKSGESFKVVLVRDDEIQDGIFLSLIKDHPGAVRNATHIKDFFIYKDIDFICVSREDAKKINASHTFLFFHIDKKIPDDVKKTTNFISLNGETYWLTRFLDFLPEPCFLDNVKILRESFPKYVMQDQYKIFISRSKARDRKYSKEQELEETAKDLGYKIVHLEDMNITEQVALIQTASHILCQYGSALVNASLADRCKILSINYTEDYYVPSYDVGFKEYGVDHTMIKVSESDSIESIKGHILEWENNQ